MKIREDFKAYNTPRELSDALPNVSPLDKSVFLSQAYSTEKLKVDGQWTWKQHLAPGHFKMHAQMYDALESMAWNQLFNLGLDIKEPGKKSKKSKNK